MSGFAIEVETAYIERESKPPARHVFAYTITITNGGAAPARLMNRYWLITDGNGERQEVRGPGVVGKQPRIEPGQAFRYTSACILETPVGVMQGHYEFHTDEGEPFKAAIDPFTLAVPNVVQ